jgi:AAA15 family ATPase/GTPase
VIDLCHSGKTSFSIGCHFDNTVQSPVRITVSVQQNDFHTIKLDDDAKPFFKSHPYDETPIQETLSHLFFLDSIPAKMRDYSFKSNNRSMSSDGSNLSSVLYHLWQLEKNQSILLDFIQSLPEQKISTIDFIETPRDEVMLTLTETFGHQKRDYDVSLLSDGTLRVLAIAAALLSAPEGSLIVIEEIDNGVHPSRAQHLLANIREIADRRNLRVLLSTHNPALMDALPDEALSDVVFCYRDPQDGDSRLTRLGDIDNFPGLVSQGPLGHLVTTGVVDRFVKHPTTPEERKQKALAWIQAFEEIA